MRATRKRRLGPRRTLGLVGAALGARWLWSKLRARRGRAGLDGQVALVTGGSRGLGLLIARELAAEGCRVAICARDRDELERARRDLEEHGAKEVLALRCDVSRPSEVEGLVSEVIGHFGSIDVLVNNAGIIQVAPLEALSLDDFHQAMSIIFWGEVYTTMAVLPHMRARRHGRIVNVTSIGAKVAVPHLLPYDCAKFAAAGFSEGLRAEVARAGVSVTTVIPGLMRTGSAKFAVFKGKREGERRWFSLAAQMPGLTMSAHRAARMIVGATKRREPEVVLGASAKLLRLLKELFPNPTAHALSVGNRLLPNPSP